MQAINKHGVPCDPQTMVPVQYMQRSPQTPDRHRPPPGVVHAREERDLAIPGQAAPSVLQVEGVPGDRDLFPMLSSNNNDNNYMNPA